MPKVSAGHRCLPANANPRSSSQTTLRCANFEAAWCASSKEAAAVTDPAVTHAPEGGSDRKERGSNLRRSGGEERRGDGPPRAMHPRKKKTPSSEAGPKCCCCKPSPSPWWARPPLIHPPFIHHPSTYSSPRCPAPFFHRSLTEAFIHHPGCGAPPSWWPRGEGDEIILSLLPLSLYSSNGGDAQSLLASFLSLLVAFKGSYWPLVAVLVSDCGSHVRGSLECMVNLTPYMNLVHLLNK